MQSFPEYEPVSLRDDDQSAERDALLGTLLAGRYRIEALIGAGGMGAVYRAAHVHMRKAVAVKVLHKEMTAFPEVVARFEREAVAAGRIEHPHVVSASDFGKLEDGSFYLVLEFIEGQSLAKLVSKAGALSPLRALRITRQIVEALQAAHAVGIVHRDLKPDNVMLVDKDGDPDFVKVLDFGIAKVKVEETVEQPALTQIGTVFGTPEYMSPEQARGELVDARSDLYTVGVILFEMLAGSSPFKDDDLVVLLTRHLTADPPPLPSSVDPMIRDLVLLLLRKDREQRPQSAAELIERIDAILSAQVMGTGANPVSGVMRAGHGMRSSADLVVTAREPAEAFSPTIMGETTPPALALNALAQSLFRRQLSLAQTVFERKLALAQALLKRPISLGARTVPAWLLVVGALGSVLAVATLIVLSSLLFGSKREAATLKDDASHNVVAKDSELSQLIARAQGGDQTALAELSARPEAMRAGNEWLALGRGYAKLEHLSASLAAYQKGVALKPELSHDPGLLADVRRAALDATTSEVALKFAATSLGAGGVDLLYDVWDSSKAVPSRAATTKLARGYLDDDAVRANASPALKLLLELGKAQKEGCASVKRWLGRAASDGDARVVPALKRFDDRRGCGFLGLSDCYSCLRAGKDLGAAANGAAARPAPSFD
ncbi:MAG TPA: serine/threonine-protein kinase [Polyangiaceae bacterium]|nr:serine/threonine-protein kinase [Polyangiaceae bacterium]